MKLTTEQRKIISRSLENSLRSMEHTNRKLPQLVNENRTNKMNELKNLITLMEEN